MATGDIQIFSREHNPRKAIVGDGTGDYVQIDGWGPARQFGGTADTVGTFTAWVNIKSASDSYSILSAGDTNAIEYINFQIVNGKLNLSLADGGVLDIDVEADGDDIFGVEPVFFGSQVFYVIDNLKHVTDIQPVIGEFHQLGRHRRCLAGRLVELFRGLWLWLDLLLVVAAG
ncbi:hypothetical protein LCGC14_2397990, partial [marine sediment metagenome]